jgi:hypothetical protein
MTEQLRATDSYRAKDPKWDGRKLRLKTGHLLVTVEPDSKYPRMFRVRMRDGSLSDMANITWAKDAAVHLALADLNRHVRRAEAPPMRLNLEAA